MKLSDAAVLGAATWKRTCFPATKLGDGSSGCFLQLALRAAGYSAVAVVQADNWAILAKKTWPWLNEWTRNRGEEEHTHCHSIWRMNDDNVPFEQILAYVRQHEPAEPSAVPESESLSGFAAQPGVESGQQPATDALESLVESDRDWSANTR